MRVVGILGGIFRVAVAVRNPVVELAEERRNDFLRLDDLAFDLVLVMFRQIAARVL